MKKLAASLLVMLALAVPAIAQDFPTRQMTMVIPFAAGGPTDLLGRVIAQRMGEILGQTVVVENIGGAGGMTGSKRVADAKPDGYTFLLGTVGTHAQNQSLFAHPAYNAVTDFTPVALIAEVPIVLIVRKDLPVNDLKSFVAYAKANEGKLQFGSAGAGSATHLGCVVLNTAMGTPKITHVPYKGTGPAMQDLVSGRIDYLCEIISTAKPQIDGGNVKAIAIMTRQRSPVEPNLPTALEQGLDVQAYTWNAVFLPKGAPEAVVKKLNAAIVEAMKTPSVRSRLESFGAQIVDEERTSPAYLARFVKSEIEKWAAPIKASGVQIN
ncbi:MAG TPA: tripartite tricarboxylate transporter substrate-binding protein [Pseudolabrys sp.]|jgi:tripartite-type tricarboxylate transporter receptor subunit TctC|nr:tripartite tricarboxylate transporter substrate-binding protein [Pseudolabrys sp.]